MDGRFVNEFAGSHEIYENPPESWVSLKCLDSQRFKIEDVVLQCSNETMHISQEYNPIILHENIFFFGSQLQVIPFGFILLIIEKNNLHFVNMCSIPGILWPVRHIFGLPSI